MTSAKHLCRPVFVPFGYDRYDAVRRAHKIMKAHRPRASSPQALLLDPWTQPAIHLTSRRSGPARDERAGPNDKINVYIISGGRVPNINGLPSGCVQAPLPLPPRGN